VKSSKAENFNKVHAIPSLKFEDQQLTSFSGLIIFQKFFQMIGLKEQLESCFKHLPKNPSYSYHLIALLLIIHLLVGYRRLRDLDYYRKDPIVLRILGLRKLPDVSTVSRSLSSMDTESFNQLRGLNKRKILETIYEHNLTRLTIDFDGSVLSTGRKAEGTAVGFNKKKKGARSYYPLFVTLAQTSQVFDVHFRSGNVHDSNGAAEFITQTLFEIRLAFPEIKIEVRMDSAFFSEDIIEMLEKLKIEYTISVPFERFSELKAKIEGRRRWRRIDGEWFYFDEDWRPKKWEFETCRFLFTRRKVKKLYKEPIQLDLFIPHEYGYEFKVTVTNKKSGPKNVLMFHNGRGSQEGIFAELKDHVQMDYVPFRKMVANQIFLMSAIFSHNLNRQLQMKVEKQQRGTTFKRAALWIFRGVKTVRHQILQHAGRLNSPQGKLTLTLNANESVQNGMLHFLDALQAA